MNVCLLWEDAGVVQHMLISVWVGLGAAIGVHGLSLWVDGVPEKTER